MAEFRTFLSILVLRICTLIIWLKNYAMLAICLFVNLLL